MTSPQGPMTGTDDRPVERIPEGPSTWPDWAVLLGGPVIWISHFMLVYLAAEASCVPTEGDQYDIIGTDALVVLTIVATVVAALACAGVAWIARARTRERDIDDRERYVIDMARAGLVLALGGVIGVIAVGVPAAFLSPVC